MDHVWLTGRTFPLALLLAALPLILTASLAIAAHVTRLLAGSGLDLGPAEELEPVRMPNLGEAFPRPYQRPELIAADLAFHRIILEATGNPILRSLGTMIERSLSISFSLSWRQNPQEETVRQHARVYDAIRRGDGEAASLFMRRLIESAAQDVVASLYSQPDDDCPDPDAADAASLPSKNHQVQ